MHRIGRKIEYSLMALKHMSQKRQDELTSAKEVADSFSAPFDATARVLQLMAQNGLVKSEHGVNGGYRLNKDLADVTFHDLMEIVQGPTHIAKCMSEEESCELKSSCNITSPIANLDKRINELYQKLTLKELLIK